MKKVAFRFLIFVLLLGSSVQADAQFNLARALGALFKTAQAFTLSDEQMAAYVKESVEQMDKNNTVLPEDSKYTQRLRRLTKGISDADGIPLNFKVYDVKDINAFACPDGSVRVFSALMDMMDDNELMGIIGHEIGHVVKRHSKNAFKNELLGGALKDIIASTDGRVAALTDSQLTQLGESLLNARYSQKQETEADDCGYDFLVQNGLNPWGMVMAFEKMQGLEGNSSQSIVQKMFSSHPDTAKRIQNMTARCRKDGIPRPASK